MNKPRRMRLAVLNGVFCLLALGLVIGASAASSYMEKPDDPDDSLPYSKQAKTYPISQRAITLTVIMDDGDTSEITQLEGGTIRLKRLSDGITVGLVPVFDENGELVVRVYTIEEQVHLGKRMGESMCPVTSQTVGKNPVRIDSGTFGFYIQNKFTRPNERDGSGKKNEKIGLTQGRVP